MSNPPLPPSQLLTSSPPPPPPPQPPAAVPSDCHWPNSYLPPAPPVLISNVPPVPELDTTNINITTNEPVVPLETGILNNISHNNNYEFKQKLQIQLNSKLNQPIIHQLPQYYQSPSPDGADTTDCSNSSPAGSTYKHQNSECELVPNEPRYGQKLESGSNNSEILLNWTKCNWWIVLFLGLYNGFLGTAIYRTWWRTPNYFDGVKVLTIITGLVYFRYFYIYWARPFYRNRKAQGRVWSPPKCCSNNSTIKWSKIVFWTLVQLLLLTYVVRIVWSDTKRLQSIGGYFLFIFIGFLCSKHRRAIKWNQIAWGLTIQLVFGIFVLRTPLGRVVFANIGNKVNTFLSYTNNGTELIFGRLATGLLLGPIGNVTVLVNGTEQTVELLDSLPMPVQNSIFAFTAMPVVIFFSFFVSILYHFGLMQVVVRQLGWLLQVTIGTTACESISASGNIFLGMTESPLLVRPFLGQMTKSELHAVLTGGFATIAGSVMAAYISFGISATHLLSASVMAAPSALALSKLMYPETEVSRTSIEDIKMDTGTERNVIEAGSNGASSAVKLVSNILANLIAFMAFLAFLDAMVGWFGAMIEVEDLSFKYILSKLFIPVALMLGIEWTDCEEIASLIGLKMVINEFVAYQELGSLIKNNGISHRSETIVTFALCGFANFGSIGIQVGGLSAMAPERKADLAEIAFRAMVTGAMASFMTACVGGMLI